MEYLFRQTGQDLTVLASTLDDQEPSDEAVDEDTDMGDEGFVEPEPDDPTVTDLEDIFEAVEIAIATATRKRYGAEQDFRVDIDRETGDYETYRRWAIMDDEDPEFESPDLLTF